MSKFKDFIDSRNGVFLWFLSCTFIGWAVLERIEYGAANPVAVWLAIPSSVYILMHLLPVGAKKKHRGS